MSESEVTELAQVLNENDELQVQIDTLKLENKQLRDDLVSHQTALAEFRARMFSITLLCR